MNNDLFGNIIENYKSPAEEELLDYDRRTFNDRLKCLRFVNRKFPKVDLWFGSDESAKIFHESINAYVFGHHISTIMLSQAFIERRFQELFYIRFDKKYKYTLSKILEYFKETGFIDDYFIDRVNKVRLKRNPFVHLREPTDKDSLFIRTKYHQKSPYHQLEEDSKDALEIMLIISKLRVM